MQTTQDPDRRVEAARADLLAHVEELARRVQDMRAKLDIKSKIAANPWPAVGIAFAVGALLALPKRSKKTRNVQAAEVKGGLIGAGAATLGTLAFTLIKNIAMSHLSGVAKDWWDARQQAMEADASRTRDVESFLEH